MFYVKDPCTLNRPWILSKKGPVVIPLSTAQWLKNYQLLAIEFLYHNYRKGVNGSILNEDAGMNFPLQVAAFLGAVAGEGTVLVVCPQSTSMFWHYHLENHAGFEVVHVDSKNCSQAFRGKVALIVHVSDIKFCENFENFDFFSVVIENLDQLATKLIVRRLNGKFNIGLSSRSFYINPDQKLQWKMLNWADPGCVGKLNDFYEIDNQNFENFDDCYRFWWFRLTWNFCESFKRPTEEESDSYENAVSDWASENSLDFPRAPEKPAKKRKVAPLSSDSSSDTIINEVPSDKYVKLPSMDENPIVTSIIKNFEISPEPVRPCPQPNCSKFYDDNSIILSFLDNKERPSTSKSESEEFIISLIEKKADALLQN